MTTSAVGIQLICEFEGFRAAAYPDVVGVWTIGYGTTRVNNQPVTKGMTCTEAQAKEWVHTDLRQFEAAVTAASAKPLTQFQFDACVCFAYNIGAGGFASSTVGRKLRTGNIALINESNFVAWNKVRNSHGVLVESRGLTRRRKAEWYLFSTGMIKTQFE
jgi:lysozyme